VASVAGVELTPTKIVSAVHPGVRRTAAQRVAYQKAWAQNNERARQANGPLWVALGDSTALSVGASNWERGYFALTNRALRAATGAPWRVINLAEFGAKISDVLDQQLPRLAGVGPVEFLAVAAGSNDVLWTLPRRRALSEIDRLLAALPPGTYVGEMSRGIFGRWSAANDRLRLRAPVHGHIAVDSWTDTPRSMIGADGIHPNDAGHDHIARQTVAAMGLDPALIR